MKDFKKNKKQTEETGKTQKSRIDQTVIINQQEIEP